MPHELFVQYVFSYLRPEELARISIVSRTWHQLCFDSTVWKAFDVEKLFPLKVLDEKAWNAHVDLKKIGITVDDFEPLDNRVLIPKISTYFAKLEEEEYDLESGATLLTVPKYLSLRKLKKIVEASGQALQFNILPRHLEMDESNPATYQILITNSSLPGVWRYFFYSDHDVVKKVDCELPKVLEASTHAIMSYLDSGKLPIAYTEGNHTHCKESSDDKSSLLGGADPDELEGNFVSNDLLVGFILFYGRIGITPMRRLVTE